MVGLLQRWSQARPGWGNGTGRQYYVKKDKSLPDYPFQQPSFKENSKIADDTGQKPYIRKAFRSLGASAFQKPRIAEPSAAEATICMICRI
jgi:hypothetical protein